VCFTHPLVCQVTLLHPGHRDVKLYENKRDVWMSDVSEFTTADAIHRQVEIAKQFLTPEFTGVLVTGMNPKLQSHAALRHVCDWCLAIEAAWSTVVAVPGRIQAPAAHRSDPSSFELSVVWSTHCSLICVVFLGGASASKIL
jgi:hypothetical protein